MVNFKLGNPGTIEELVSRECSSGKFVLKRNDDAYLLFLGESYSHPKLVEEFKILKPGEIEYDRIWGGGDFNIMKNKLMFSGSSGTYGRVPNSFLIECCKQNKISRIEEYTFSLTPYDPKDNLLEQRRETWRKLGDFELDIERKKYIFDRDMNFIKVETLPKL